MTGGLRAPYSHSLLRSNDRGGHHSGAEKVACRDHICVPRTSFHPQNPHPAHHAPARLRRHHSLQAGAGRHHLRQAPSLVSSSAAGGRGAERSRFVGTRPVVPSLSRRIFD
eukprot:747362-Prymnesium_polylepis.1